MTRDGLLDEISEIKAKVDCIAFLNGDRGESAEHGFYLIIDGISRDLDKVCEDLKLLGDFATNQLSELFTASK